MSHLPISIKFTLWVERKEKAMKPLFLQKEHKRQGLDTGSHQLEVALELLCPWHWWPCRNLELPPTQKVGVAEVQSHKIHHHCQKLSISHICNFSQQYLKLVFAAAFSHLMTIGSSGFWYDLLHWVLVEKQKIMCWGWSSCLGWGKLLQNIGSERPCTRNWEILWEKEKGYC